MPWLAIPVAAVLAWIALKGRLPRRSDLPALTGGDGALEPGRTGVLEPSEDEEPFKRRELPFGREGVPYASGGEIGGPYGPETQQQSPSASDGFYEPPAPTQTQTLASYAFVQQQRAQQAALAQAAFEGAQQYVSQLSAPTTAISPTFREPSGTQTAIKIPTSLVAPTSPSGGAGSLTVKAL